MRTPARPDTDREHRLRLRIDELVDERDCLRRRLEKLVIRNRRNYDKAKTARFWRDRAMRR